MNGKTCKYLRKAVGVTKFDVRSQTTRTLKTVGVETGRLNPDGKPQVRLEARQLVENTGSRKEYRGLKRFLKRQKRGLEG